MAKISDSTQLGRLVRERRKQANLTLKDAAGMAGVGVRFLSELERGKPTVQIGLCAAGAATVRAGTSRSREG